MEINDSTRVRLIARGDPMDPNDPNDIMLMTLGQFIAANDFEPGEIAIIRETLASGGVWVTGGGAAQVFSLDLEEPHFFTDPFEGQWRFIVQHRTARGWEGSAMTLDRPAAEREMRKMKRRFPEAEYRIKDYRTAADAHDLDQAAPAAQPKPA